MKINTGIITVLKIKIENSTFVVSIFKWLRYIDQAQPRFFFSPFCAIRGMKGKLKIFHTFKVLGEKKSAKWKKVDRKKHKNLYSIPSNVHTR